VKGMTEQFMLDYIDEILLPWMPPNSILFLDRLSSHMTTRVQQRFKELSITPIYFPPKTAPDLSACDNFFFHKHVGANVAC